jgi:hypothetical protein
VVESWSFEARPSADAEGIRSVPAADYQDYCIKVPNAAFPTAQIRGQLA